MPIRLLVADSHPVVRAGLFSFFVNTDVQVVDEAHTAAQTLEKTSLAWPDVLMLDVDFPDRSGFDVVSILRANRFDRRIVFFASEERQERIARAVAVGADSYLLSSTARADLLRIVKELAELRIEPVYVSTEQTIDAAARIEAFGANSGELRRLAGHMRRRAVDDLNPLTAREEQVLRHIALGLSNKEIASSLQLRIDTIKEHVQNILRKLDVSDRTQAAVWAVRNKLIP